MNRPNPQDGFDKWEEELQAYLDGVRINRFFSRIGGVEVKQEEKPNLGEFLLPSK